MAVEKSDSVLADCRYISFSGRLRKVLHDTTYIVTNSSSSVRSSKESLSRIWRHADTLWQKPKTPDNTTLICAFSFEINLTTSLAMSFRVVRKKKRLMTHELILSFFSSLSSWSSGIQGPTATHVSIFGNRFEPCVQYIIGRG